MILVFLEFCTCRESNVPKFFQITEFVVPSVLNGLNPRWYQKEIDKVPNIKVKNR